eukprot:EG_transcript_9565
MALNWKNVYFVGTEWYIYEERKDAPSERHACYHKILEQKPEWDFGHILPQLKELIPADASCYLFGGSEGHILSGSDVDPNSVVPTLVPVICALITSQPAPQKFGIQHKDKDEELVDIEALGCQWKDLGETGNIKYLSCKHVDDMKEIEAAPVEEQAKYGYTSLFIEPEKVQPDADPDADEDNNVIYVAYSTGQSGAMQIEFDIRRDNIQKVAKRTVKEEEIGEEHIAKIEEALAGPVESAQKKKDAEKQRRAAMDEASKAAWRASHRVKFYPQNDGLQLENKFINRYFGKATHLFPVPKPTAGFGFGAGFSNATSTNPFFNAGPPVEITDEAPAAPAPTPEAPKAEVAKEDQMEVDKEPPSKKEAKPKKAKPSAEEQKKKREEAAAKKAALAQRRKEAAEKSRETRKRNREAAEAAGPKPDKPEEAEEEAPARQLRKRQRGPQ